MDGIDDLLSKENLDEMMSELSDAQEAPAEAKTRPSLKTPILSGRAMAGPAASQELKAGPMVGEVTRLTSPDQLSTVSFDTIYRRAGLPEVASDAFTVYRVEQLVADDDIADLDERARLAAVRMTLKSHDVEPKDIVDDARRRAQALDDYDEKLHQQIERLVAHIEEENQKLESEIEEYSRPRLDRIENNKDRVERARENYQTWKAKKESEQERILSIVLPWADEVPDEPASDGREGASTAPIARLQSTPLGQVLAEDGAQTYDLGDTVEAPSVQTDLPVEEFSATFEREAETEDFSVTGIQPALRLPAGVGQWLVVAFAVVFWAMGAVLFPAQMSQIKAPFAVGLGVGLPLFMGGVAALIREHWTRAFFSAMLVSSLVTFSAAHYDVQKLVDALSVDTLWFVDELGAQPLNAPLQKVTRPYADALVGLGLAREVPPRSEPAPTPSQRPLEVFNASGL